jgi:membrane protease YdiL (CAAX protease family)
LNLSAVGRTSAGTLRATWRLVCFAFVLIITTVLVTLLMGVLTAKVRLVGSAGTLANIADALSAETLASIVDVIATLGATWVALRWIDHKPWSEVGLDGAAAKPKLIIGGFLLGGGAIALPILLLILVGWLRSTLVTTVPWGHPIIRVTALLVPAAFAEELLTRGYLLTVLRDAWNWPVSVAVTSIAFGLLHLRNPGANVQSVALVTLAGVFLATIRIATGSLYAAWAAHFAWNWMMAAVFHASVSGLPLDAPGYRYVDAGPDWATGGAWGPEGGIPAGIAMIAGTGLLLMRLRRRAEEKG